MSEEEDSNCPVWAKIPEPATNKTKLKQTLITKDNDKRTCRALCQRNVHFQGSLLPRKEEELVWPLGLQ
jgi:hypothetical protein